MDQQHEMVSALKDLAIELGRVPNKDEFHAKTKFSHYAVAKAFGTYTALRQAADLGIAKQHESRITNQVFERPIEKHLEDFIPRPRQEPQKYPSVLIINDIHWPFHSQRVVDKFLRRVSDRRPEFVILNGDALDLYSHSKFPRSHNVFSPREEQTIGRKLNAEFWEAVRMASPGSKCYQLLGNHDIRPMRRVLESYPEAEDWIEKGLRELFTHDGVETIFDSREELMLPGDIAIHHGYKTKLGDHRDFTLLNCVSGHTHRPGVVYRTVRGAVLWELNTGYAGDPEAKGLTYTSQKITNSVQSFGEIDEDGPRVVIA